MYINISHRKQDRIEAYQDLTFASIFEIVFQLLVISHMYFYITEFISRLQNHGNLLHKDSQIL